MRTAIIYGLAAVAEIAGCYAFWSWWRLEKSPAWLLPGMVSLVLFAILLAQVPVGAAGRAYAAYGGVYIIASLLWLWLVEGQIPDRWDMAGASLCLGGAVIILAGHRTL